MPRIRERVTKALFKLESTVGTDASPTGTDFLRIRQGSTFSLNPDIRDNPELRGGYGEGEHSVGALLPAIQLLSSIRGSGAAATPPEVAALLAVCGFVETVNSSALAAITASAGTSTSVTAPHGGVWPSSTSAGEVLIGQPVILGGTLPAPFTGGTVVDVISGYTVSGADATITLSTTYGSALGANATITRPISTIYKSGTPSPHPAGTAYLYLDGLLQTFLGCRGTWTGAYEGRGFGVHQFDLSGFYGARTDASMLTGETDDTASPNVFVDGICHLNRLAVCANSVNIATNMAGYFPTCPAATYGVDPYEVTGRAVRVSLDPDLTLVATANHVAQLVAGTTMPFALLLGHRTSGSAGTRHTAFLRNGKLRTADASVDNGTRKVPVELGSTLVNDELTLAFF